MTLERYAVVAVEEPDRPRLAVVVRSLTHTLLIATLIPSVLFLPRGRGHLVRARWRACLVLRRAGLASGDSSVMLDPAVAHHFRTDREDHREGYDRQHLRLLPQPAVTDTVIAVLFFTSLCAALTR